MDIAKVEDLKFSYDGKRQILNGIDLVIKEGEILGIMGVSGCGKSTLCSILCGIIPNEIGGHISGDVVVDGVRLADGGIGDIFRIIGYVMQEPDRQIVTSAVEDEIAFGPENICVEPEEIRMRVDRILKLLDLEEMRGEDPNDLSGGEQQLVAIGSILALEPKIMVFDEPFSNLDKKHRRRLLQIIKRLRDDGITVVIVEHDHRLIEDADRIVFIEDGRVKHSGKPEDIVGAL